MARIAGSSYLRTHPTGNDTAEPASGNQDKRDRKKRERERKAKALADRRPVTGGMADGPKSYQVTPKQDATLQSDTQPSYPLGKRLRFTEYEAPKVHAPKDGVSGKPLCWNFNSNCGCSFKCKECEHGLRKVMRKNGIHWTAQAQLARRGGMKGSKTLTASEIDGFIFSLRKQMLRTRRIKLKYLTQVVTALSTAKVNLS